MIPTTRFFFLHNFHWLISRGFRILICNITCQYSICTYQVPGVDATHNCWIAAGTRAAGRAHIAGEGAADEGTAGVGTWEC